MYLSSQQICHLAFPTALVLREQKCGKFQNGSQGAAGLRLKRSLGGSRKWFLVKKLDALLDGFMDRLDDSEDVVKAYYCFINRIKGGRKGGKKEGKMEEKTEGQKEGEREELQMGGKKLRIQIQSKIKQFF